MKRVPSVFAALALVATACGTGTTPTFDSEPITEPTETAPPGPPRTLAVSVSRTDPDPAAPVAQLVTGFNDAGFELLGRQGTENFVFSPLSIGHALLMARGAADDPTGRAIDARFDLPEDRAAHQAWNALDQQLGQATADQDEMEVTIADRIWPRIGLEPEQDWIDLLAAEHGASVETLDLSGDPTGSRKHINEWVSQQTQGLIPDLLPDGFITPQTLLVLTDAVYFEARWQTPFGKYGTVSEDFTLLDGSTIQVEYMRELELLDRRGVGDGFVAAEIPYVGGEFSMLLIVPDRDRFTEIRDSLDQGLVDTIDRTFEEGPFELLVPKWETTTNLDLLPWLEEAGVAPGSYPGIDPSAFLAGAVHGADIAVDEEGTVAAAATGLGFNESAGAMPELTIAADRPFLYLIRHRPSGAVLFAGQVTDPR
ncbi:MAG TPA: serpin family protein [Acidimicrobiia bacterium]|nr:serpin family protein [Acidimicrobiia bacterium]